MAFLQDKTNALSGLREREEVLDLPGLGGDALSNLTGVGAVVHQEQFNVFFVSDEELSEARSEHVSGLLLLLAADLGLSDLASEASSHGGVNTSLLSPRSLRSHKHDVSTNSISPAQPSQPPCQEPCAGQT